MLNALADLIKVDRSNVLSSYLEENDGPLLTRASKKVLTVGVLLRYLDPVSTRDALGLALAACSPPITEMREFGHIHRNRGMYPRPHIP